MKKLLLILLLTLPITLALDLSIDSVIKTPQQTSPGEEFSIEVRVENEGSDDIENIRVSLDLTELPFAPMESSEKFFDKVKDDDKRTARFELRTLPGALPGIYKVPITIKQDTEVITSFTSITISSNPILEVGIEENNIITTNQKGSLIIRFVNTGEGEVKFLTVNIPKLQSYEVLSQDSFYIGNIEPDDFETIELELLLKNNINTIPLQVSYKDSFNNEFEKIFPLEIKTYTREEAIKFGLIKERNMAQTAAFVLIALILFFAYKRHKRRNK